MSDSLKPIALFDLDGSLADYDTAMQRGLALLDDPDHAVAEKDFWGMKDVPWMKARMHAVRSKPGWWSGLERMEEGFVVVRMAKEMGFAINVLTKGPSEHSMAWAEKLDWCHQQPELQDADIHITMNKGLVYGHFLYDDFPPYMDAWLEHRPRGLGIMPLNESNKNYSHQNVFRWDGLDRDGLYDALHAAYSRERKEPLHLGR